MPTTTTGGCRRKPNTDERFVWADTAGRQDSPGNKSADFHVHTIDFYRSTFVSTCSRRRWLIQQFFFPFLSYLFKNNFCRLDLTKSSASRANRNLTSCARGDTICSRPSPPSVGAEAPHAAEPTETYQYVSTLTAAAA